MRVQVISALFTLSALVGPKGLFAKGRKDPQNGSFGPMVHGLKLVHSALKLKMIQMTKMMVKIN